MIRVYIYDKANGLLIREDFGLASHVMQDIKDSTDFTLIPPPDYSHVWRWVEDRWVADEPEAEPVEVLQASVWSNIKDKRSLELSKSILLESIGKVFQTDSNSITEYNNIASMIALDNYSPIEWKTEDNTFILLTIDLFKELQKAISNNTQRIFKIAEDHKEAMLALADPLEYDYLTNW